MVLTPGTRLGSYEILGTLGEGGMGKVYRARDTKLNRDVAIKVLSELVVADADRVARFRREAQVLASLNHSNIAHLYGFEDSSPAFLVMELVEGPTLADLIDASKGIRIEDALPIATQIALALEVAHEQGIVHRDLKPANVKVRDDGTVKVLDFGLAKAVETNASTASADAMNSPTLTNRATQLGMILGTAAYMSPEQAKGRSVDKRADIWAFGVVLYEMLTGRRLFDGDSVAETIGFVATREPDWTALPPATPVGVRRLLRRCLTRDPKQRLRDIGEARIALADLSASDIEPTRPEAASRTPPRAALLAGALALVVIATSAGWFWGSRTPEVPIVAPYRSEIVPTPADAFERRSTATQLTFTPDGRTLIYASTDPAARLLYRRDRDSAVAVPIAGTEGAYGPFASSDGASIGFFADGAIKRVPMGGGAAQVIHNMRASAAPDTLGFGWTTEVGPGREVGFGATWLADNTIVYGRFFGGLWRISADGGTPTPLTKVIDGEIGHRLPHALPGGRAVLCTVIRDLIAMQDSSVEAVDVTTGARTKLIDNATDARYAGHGTLLFARRGAVYSVGFDPVSLKLSGDPVQVSDNVMHAIGGGRPGQASGAAQYDVSADGMVAVIGGGTNAGVARLVVWVSQGGRIDPISQEPSGNLGPRLSQDDTRMVVRKAPDVSIVNLRDGIATPLIKAALFPVWNHDDTRVLVAQRSANNRQEIYSVPLSGAAPDLVAGGANPLWPSSVSRDGKFLAYVESSSATGNDIWIMGLSPKTAPIQVAATPASEGYPMFSPNGKWLAYAVEEGEGDADGVYVQPFPGPGRAERIAGRGTTSPVWARDGKSVLYGRLSADTSTIVEIVRIPIDSSDDRLRIGSPVTFATGAFNKSVPVSNFDVSTDVSRVLTTVDAPPASGATPAPLAARTIRLIFLRR